MKAATNPAYNTTAVNSAYQPTKEKFKLKDPGSAITHFIGMIIAIFAAVPLLSRAYDGANPVRTASIAVFIASMILLYGASTAYHSFNLSERLNRILKKTDHMMIFILIAGTYTPICLVVLKGTTGIIMFSLIWGMALAGILIKALWIYCPKWFSSLIYIGMGWTCIFAFTPLLHTLPLSGFLWLAAGGVIYTIGGIIYALKLSIFNTRHKNFGSHEIFHIFVMGGSICHFILMMNYVAYM